MRRFRVIPTLLLWDGALVKTRRFADPTYLGDPINAVRMFNEKGADELVLLDISAAGTDHPLSIGRLQEIVSEAFMPVAYGGGITSLGQIDELFRAGVEKVVVNTAAVTSPQLIQGAARRFGSQAIVGSMDVRRSVLGGRRVYTHRGRRRTGLDPVTHARRLEALGIGEVLLTSIDHEGMGRGYDVELIRAVSEAIAVPVVANGGASALSDFVLAVREGRASAVAAGSLFVFHGAHRAVLINYPSDDELRSRVFSMLPAGR